MASAAHHLPPRATSRRESQAPLAAVRWMRMLDLKFDLSLALVAVWE
jgi:hypothetical protein